MVEGLERGAERFLEDMPPREREQTASILAACPILEIDGHAARFGATVAAATLLLVVEGFVVLRAMDGRGRRSIVTCEAGPGSVVLPPSAEEALVALGESRLLVVDRDLLGQLLRIPAAAERIVEQLTLALGQKQEATANFAPTHHIERVRRKLLQLGRSHGHVVPDGIRIDFPVSHALLAEMIGSSRETVTRAVDELQRRGFVARRGSTYRLLASPETVFEPTQPTPV
jgi:CRP/FNR family cyclic AMP-dependent transcriptional regulator